MKNLIDQLDKISSSLEDQGLIKEAEEIDIISNTLEKLAFELKRDPAFKNLQKAMEFAQAGNIKNAEQFLIQANIAEKAKATFPKTREVQQVVKAYNDALASAKKEDAGMVVKSIQTMMNFLKKAEPDIIKGMYPGTGGPSQMIFPKR